MKKILFVLLTFAYTSSALATERTNAVSVGGGLGFLHAAPWANDTFRDSVSFFGLRGGIWGRYHLAMPGPGFELAFDRLEFAKSTISATAATISFFWRYLPGYTWHPVFAFGGGIANVKNYFTSGDRQLSVYRARLGVEFELQPQMEVGAYLDHFSIFRNKKSEPDAHSLSPVLVFSYYFQAPAPAAPAAK